MAIAKRTILEALTRPELLAIAEDYELHVEDRRVPVRIVSSSGPSSYHSDAKVRGPGVVTGRYGTIGKGAVPGVNREKAVEAVL